MNNELYWLIEELKAYTDLTGNNFDVEQAQRRMFPMQALVKNMDIPKVIILHDELLALLEIPAFFDKIAFSEKVDELYQIVANEKK